MYRRRVLLLLPLASLLMAPRCYSTQAIEAPPTYKGTLHSAGACSTEYRTLGFEPVDPDNPTAKYPLFLYFAGTEFLTGPGTYYNQGVALDVAEEMAARGFVALSVGYDNSGIALFADAAGQARQMNCLFNASEPDSLIAKACATLSRVDCSLGIATWGHSQGGRVALDAIEYAPRDTAGESWIRAAVAFGVGTNLLPLSIDATRMRVVNSVGDLNASLQPMSPADMIELTGTAPPADCAQSPDQCLREGQSGWVLVGDDIPDVEVGHCWFMSNPNCGTSAGEMQSAPAFIDSNPDVPYTLAANADFLQSAFARP